jgi:HD-GYP domain-containing protein (c-di-GMP phosphodiesterase class II)
MHASANIHLFRPPGGHTSQPSHHPALNHWSQWQAMSEWLGELLLRPKGSADFPAETHTFAETLIALTREEPDVALFHMVHARADKMRRYSVLHAMHTGMLLTLIGRRKEWAETRTATAVKAGLTMNISVTALHNELAQQISPLNAAQHEAIQDHPDASARMLGQLGVDDKTWLDAVAQHHEEPDGKGYPHQLTEIDPLADAIRTCDVFGAKISPRIGRNGMPTPKAATEIFHQRSASYFGAAILRELGLYPPGCLVELNSGERGVVVRRTTDPNAPQVVLIGQGQGVLPLATLRRADTNHESGRHIIGAATDQYWSEHIPPDAILRAL